MDSPSKLTTSDLTAFKVEVDNPFQSVHLYQDPKRVERFHRRMGLGSLAVSGMCVCLLLLYRQVPEQYSMTAFALLIFLFGASCWLWIHYAIHKWFNVLPTSDPIIEITKDGIRVRYGEFHLGLLQWKHIRKAVDLHPPGGNGFLGIIPTELHLLYGLAQNDKTKRMIDIYLRNDPLTHQPMINAEQVPPISIPEWSLPMQLDDIVTLINERKAISINLERNRSNATDQLVSILEIRDNRH